MKKVIGKIIATVLAISMVGALAITAIAQANNTTANTVESSPITSTITTNAINPTASTNIITPNIEANDTYECPHEWESLCPR